MNYGEFDWRKAGAAYGKAAYWNRDYVDNTRGSEFDCALRVYAELAVQAGETFFSAMSNQDVKYRVFCEGHRRGFSQASDHENAVNRAAFDVRITGHRYGRFGYKGEYGEIYLFDVWSWIVHEILPVNTFSYAMQSPPPYVNDIIYPTYYFAPLSQFPIGPYPELSILEEAIIAYASGIMKLPLDRLRAQFNRGKR